MKRHGNAGEIDAAVDATVDVVESALDGVRAVETASLPVHKAKSEKETHSSTTTAGFHPSLGTRNTTQRGTKPAQLLRDESLKRISHAPVPFGSLAEAFAFTAFLLVFVLATSVVGHSEHGFYFANRVRAALVERDFEIAIQNGASSVQKRFVGIHDHADVWAFLEGPFLDAVYGTSLGSASDDRSSNSSSGSAGANDQARAGTMMLAYNRVLGGVRLRSLRVQPDTCPPLARIPEYASLLPFCYGRFAASIEQTQGFGPIRNSADITASFAFRFAKAFFLADKQHAKSYSDLQTCDSDCARTCGDHYGVERFRYTSECVASCGVHCKCLYEQPVGFTHLCANPNPNGPSAELPHAIYSYNWSSAAATGAATVAAYTNSYPGSGYVVDLPLNGSLAAALVAQLKRDRFLDLATRALVVDVTLFNAYLQLFNIVQFVVEFPSSGGVFASFSDVVLDLFRYSTPHDTLRVSLELVLVAFVTWRWKTLLQNWYAMGVRAYFAHDTLWHSIEAAHLAAFLIVVAFRLYVVDLSYGTLSGAIAASLQAASPAEIPAFQPLARVQQIDAVLGSVNAALVWMQFLKYTQMSQRMCLLLGTLRRASHDLLWFLVYFLACICAFAQIGFLLFGLQLARFRTLGVAIVTLLQAVAGDLDYSTLVESHSTLGPLYYVAFYLLLLLILLNVFLAIVNDAYVQTLSEQEELEEAEQAALLRSEREEIHDQHAAADAVQRLERYELEQLRKYPFSKGLGPAARLLGADLKRTLYEMRTGKRLFKVDPMVRGMLGVMAGSSGADGAAVSSSRAPGGAGSGGGGGGSAASRKLTLQVKRQLETQLQLQDRAREVKRKQQDQEQRAVVESQQLELASRLAALVESNREKSKRLQDMESLLGSIEQLCQQLVAAALEDVPASPKRPTTTAAAIALQRQKTAKRGRSSGGKIGDGDIEEISL